MRLVSFILCYFSQWKGREKKRRKRGKKKIKKNPSPASEQAQRNFLSFVKASSCFQAFIPYKAVFSVKPEANPFYKLVFLFSSAQKGEEDGVPAMCRVKRGPLGRELRGFGSSTVRWVLVALLSCSTAWVLLGSLAAHSSAQEVKTTPQPLSAVRSYRQNVSFEPFCVGFLLGGEVLVCGLLFG